MRRKRMEKNGTDIIKKEPRVFTLPYLLTEYGEAVSDTEFRMLVIMYAEARYEDQPLSNLRLYDLASKMGRSESWTSEFIRRLKIKELLMVKRIAKKDGLGTYNEYTIEPAKRWWNKIGRRFRDGMVRDKLKNRGYKNIEKANEARNEKNAEEIRV